MESEVPFRKGAPRSLPARIDIGYDESTAYCYRWTLGVRVSLGILGPAALGVVTFASFMDSATANSLDTAREKWTARRSSSSCEARWVSDGKRCVWPAVSNRPYEKILELTRELSTRGMHGTIRPFDDSVPKIIAGKTALLSLGEGNSDFVLTLLKQAMVSYGSVAGIYAVDVQYRPHAGTELSAAIRQAVKSFPHNYVGQFFQELSLARSDEIISVYALNFILIRYPELLEKLIRQNLNFGGVLRSYGPLGAKRATVFGILERLVEEGVVSDMTVPPGQNSLLEVKKSVRLPERSGH